MCAQKHHSKSRYNLSRPHNTRNAKTIIMIVCDDRKTAGNYFKCIKRKIKEMITIEIIDANQHGMTPQQCLQLAKQNKSQKQLKPNDSTWVLIDCESEPDRQQNAQNAAEQGQKCNIKVAQSNPCFEVWTLAHLTDTGEHFANCSAVWTEIKKQWKKTFQQEPPDDKVGMDFNKLLDKKLLQQAVINTKKNNTRPTHNHGHKFIW